MLPRLTGFCHDGSEGAPCADGGDILTETVCARVAPSVLPDAALVWFIARTGAGGGATTARCERTTIARTRSGFQDPESRKRRGILLSGFLDPTPLRCHRTALQCAAVRLAGRGCLFFRQRPYLSARPTLVGRLCRQDAGSTLRTTLPRCVCSRARTCRGAHPPFRKYRIVPGQAVTTWHHRVDDGSRRHLGCLRASYPETARAGLTSRTARARCASRCGRSGRWLG